MKGLYCVSMVTALLLVCEATTTYSPTNTTANWTTPYPTGGPPVNLKGKMVTVSVYSGVTFTSPYYDQSSREDSTGPPPATANTAFPYTNTTTTPRPTPRAVSVCLRYLTEGSMTLTLSADSNFTLSGSSMQQYTVTWGYYYYNQVSVTPITRIWSSAKTQPWNSVCVTIDLYKNVIQMFEGGFMSIRKILPARMVWSGEPELGVSGFDGQVTDIEVWDYPLDDEQIYRYMINCGSSGNVLTWSNIRYNCQGNALLEEAYGQQQKQPISSGKRRDQRLRYRKKSKGRREML